MISKNFLIFLFFSSLALFFIMYLFIVTIPENPIKMRYAFFANKEIKQLAPQGWAFFTKDARLKEAHVYKVDTLNGSSKKIILTNFRSSQLFGVKRDNRLKGAKVSKIVEKIKHDMWYFYKGDINSFLNNTDNYSNMTTIEVKVSQPSLCGLYCIQVREPMPWSWV